jgi:hypothetical protein
MKMKINMVGRKKEMKERKRADSIYKRRMGTGKTKRKRKRNK